MRCQVPAAFERARVESSNGMPMVNPDRSAVIKIYANRSPALSPEFGWRAERPAIARIETQGALLAVRKPSGSGICYSIVDG